MLAHSSAPSEARCTMSVVKRVVAALLAVCAVVGATRIVYGGHGATVSENHLRDVMEFIGTGAPRRNATPVTPRPAMLRLASNFAPWVVFLIALSLAFAATRWLWRASTSNRVVRLAHVTSATIVAVIALDVF
jgi:multisubunit Na+/H+ antiporter MnhB subunit